MTKKIDDKMRTDADKRAASLNRRLKEQREARIAMAAAAKAKTPPDMPDLSKLSKSYMDKLTPVLYASLDETIYTKSLFFGKPRSWPDPVTALPLSVEGLRAMIMNLECPRRAPKDRPDQCSLTGFPPCAQCHLKLCVTSGLMPDDGPLVDYSKAF